MKVKKQFRGYRVVLFKPGGIVTKALEELTAEEVDWWRKSGGEAEVAKYFEDEPKQRKSKPDADATPEGD